MPQKHGINKGRIITSEDLFPQQTQSKQEIEAYGWLKTVSEIVATDGIQTLLKGVGNALQNRHKQTNKTGSQENRQKRTIEW